MKRASVLWTSCCESALGWLYPSRCHLCDAWSPSVVCETCESRLPLPTIDFVAEAADSPLSFRACVYEYEGLAAVAVQRLKYSRLTGLAAPMAKSVAARASLLELDGYIVIPVPIHWTRISERGFNQAELLAREIKLPIRATWLRRTRATRPQASLRLKERLTNLQGAFEASSAVRGRRILLVDDVVTTGHTALECAHVLVAAGAIEVGVLGFAGELGE